MLDITSALSRAADFLADSARAWPDLEVRIMPEEAFVHGGRLVVPYNTAAFLDRGDKGKMLAGNMPIAVDLANGSCHYCTMDEVLEFIDLDLL
ncbi:YrhB domain-containing protein [Catellatospora citrea]|uniref:Immunity protein 35 domain-containing protein n=1 Tax=Catellatospora citrea TaxID=53366 RepID=A0A8J3KDF0_9ACTN|nr:YrhB domain-containing protein [Catellatospora citrea]GIF97013.1 hypothetical protein Cci01nite_21070 [Catellatospora citrea]